MAGRGRAGARECSKRRAGSAGGDTGATTEDDLLELLSERARQGNVAAIRSLLLREKQKDPRHRALVAFEQIAEERRQ